MWLFSKSVCSQKEKSEATMRLGSPHVGTGTMPSQVFLMENYYFFSHHKCVYLNN